MTDDIKRPAKPRVYRFHFDTSMNPAAPTEFVRLIDHTAKIEALEREIERLNGKLEDCEICNQKLSAAAEGNGAYVVKPKFIENLESLITKQALAIEKLKEQRNSWVRASSQRLTKLFTTVKEVIDEADAELSAITGGRDECDKM